MPEMQETQVQSLGQKDPLEEEMAIHSGILASRSPWTEEPGGLYSPQGYKELDMTEATEQACMHYQIDSLGVKQHLFTLKRISIYIFSHHCSPNSTCFFFPHKAYFLISPKFGPHLPIMVSGTVCTALRALILHWTLLVPTQYHL